MPKETLLRTKPVALLAALKDPATTWYIAALARRANLSYIHTTKTLTKFEKDGLVFFERKGRTKYARLTEKGMAITNLLDELTAKLAPPQTPAQQKEQKPPAPPKETKDVKETKETKEAKEKEERK